MSAVFIDTPGENWFPAGQRLIFTLGSQTHTPRRGLSFHYPSRRERDGDIENLPHPQPERTLVL